MKNDWDKVEYSKFSYVAKIMGQTDIKKAS